MTDFRALCAELADAYAWCVDNYMTASADRDSLVQRARAALAQPEPQKPPLEPRGCPTPGACSCPTAPTVPPELIRALELAEAGLADIGDADRKPGDDLAWAEARAAQDLPRIRRILDMWRDHATQPEPQGPTDDELDELWVTIDVGDNIWAWQNYARTVLTRWGRPAIEPVPVAERPWEREGWCDAEGKCWWGRPSEELCNSDWFLATSLEVEEFCDGWPPIVSLPHHALPVPQQGE